MCGVVGYAGCRQAAQILLEGLEKLEYRGYDSAGLCIHSAKGFNVKKTKGRLQVLRDMTDDGAALDGLSGIGHTRWATHGAPSDVNSHPHLSNSGKIAVVHNGIIENEAKLRKKLECQGIVFRSETDTEVISNLIGNYYDSTGSITEAVRYTIARLEGSFALVILCADLPGKVIALKKDSPLIFGYGKDEYYVASDVSALLQYTKEVSYLEDGEMVIFDRETVCFYDGEGDLITKERKKIDWEQSAAERGGYDHFMLKEIFEQPKAVRDTVLPRIHDSTIRLEGVSFEENYLRSLRKICFVACGSAYYVSVLAKYATEKVCRISAEAIMASEFRYSDPVVSGDDLVVLISQSGETADTIAALREAKRRGAKTLAVVNAVGSTAAREADMVLYTWAGPEIAVATTKAFSTQLAVIYLLTLHMADVLHTVSGEEYARLLNALHQLPDEMEKLMSTEYVSQIQHIASRYSGRHNAFYVGRNLDSAICLEGSLKLKEVAYLHSEAYPAGELKHGPIAMIEKGTLVVALATVDSLFNKTVANIKEVKARGADVVCITAENRIAEAKKVADWVIAVPAHHPLFRPSLSLIPLQLFAYYVAVYRGCDVDKPRNLAKSVTVE